MKLPIVETVKCNGTYVPISHCFSICGRAEGRDDITGELICNLDFENENYYKKRKNKNGKVKATEVGFV